MKPVVYTVLGTGISDPLGFGFSGDIGRAFAANPWDAVAAQLNGTRYDGPAVQWQPIGNYPATVFPMNLSIQAGRAEVNRQIGLRPSGTPIILSGYSQGAIVTGEVWAYDILDPTGIHHDRVDDVIGIIQFGDPIRCPGIANGNMAAGLPAPTQLDGQTTGGIAGPRCLTVDQTPDFYLSCALDGDLYAAAPIGDDPWTDEPLVGAIETAIYDFVLSANVFEGIEVIAQRIAQTFEHPIDSIVAHCEAIFNGLTFAAEGPNAPHYHYEPFVPAMIDWILGRVGSRSAA